MVFSWKLAGLTTFPFYAFPRARQLDVIFCENVSKKLISSAMVNLGKTTNQSL